MTGHNDPIRALADALWVADDMPETAWGVEFYERAEAILAALPDGWHLVRELAFIRATAPSPVQLRYYVPMTRRSVDRLLDRANAEGRTAVRCVYCGDAIEQLPAGLFGGGAWSTDYGARCPGRRAPAADGNWMHEPRPEQLNAL